MKRKLTAGLTGVSLPIFVNDTTSTTGGGLAGLVFGTAGLVAEYRRQGQATWQPITLVAGTLGTYLSGSFVADGALAGAYEFCPPDACLAASARWVAIRLRGAANMLPVLMEIELDAVNYQDGAAFGLSRIDAAVSSRSTFAGGAVASVTGTVNATLVAAGADAIQVEAGINLRQALSPILAAAAGVLSGAGTGSIVIKGGGVATTRIAATTDSSGNRTAVTLTLPA